MEDKRMERYGDFLSGYGHFLGWLPLIPLTIALITGLHAYHIEHSGGWWIVSGYSLFFAYIDYVTSGYLRTVELIRRGKPIFAICYYVLAYTLSPYTLLLFIVYYFFII